MLRKLFRRSVLTSGIIVLLAVGLVTPSQASCFFNWFNGWGHSANYGGSSNCCGPMQSYYQPPVYAPSGCNSCGYGPVMYGGSSCASGNCGISENCGTESITYESPEAGESKKPVDEEMEPIRSRNENESPDSTYSPPPEPNLEGDSNWEGTRPNFRDDLNSRPNEGRPGNRRPESDLDFDLNNETEPSISNENNGLDPLPSPNEEFNPNLDILEPSVEPAGPGEGAPSPRDQRNNNVFEKSPFGKNGTETETDRAVAKPVVPAEGDVVTTKKPESEEPAEAVEEDETSLEAPVTTPEEIESEIESELKKAQEEAIPTPEDAIPAEREGLRPLNLDNQFSLHAPARTRLRQASSSKVTVQEVVRKPGKQKALSKTDTKGPRMVSR
ncbi:hypothetical protein Pla110_23240 [Polystyrenella longa]|uniref:Uncharacterized protein n=1 Tax=Polystyrenella longa TaxID=2528007 RepID=A0A518CN07_9PLAN|nr:hypothetical protein [Polystyrenella longa]QDU80593.1 hypothetical protein Pla110_23240 [Polystyrenella longa]